MTILLLLAGAQKYTDEQKAECVRRVDEVRIQLTKERELRGSVSSVTGQGTEGACSIPDTAIRDLGCKPATSI